MFFKALLFSSMIFCKPSLFKLTLYHFIVILNRQRVLNYSNFEIDFHILLRMENSWPFCFILDLAYQVCLALLDACLSLNPPDLQSIKRREIALLFCEWLVFLNASSSSFSWSKVNYWEVIQLIESNSDYTNFVQEEDLVPLIKCRIYKKFY